MVVRPWEGVTPWTGRQSVTGLTERQTLIFTPAVHLDSPIKITHKRFITVNELKVK